VDRAGIEPDGLAQEGRQVLEGNRLGVQPMELPEGLERGRRRRPEADPREVRVELAYFARSAAAAAAPTGTFTFWANATIPRSASPAASLR
jgi:hypothetical protein